MIINAFCIGCRKPIPEKRRKDSRFCSLPCRKRYQRAYLATPAGEYPPGEYLLFQQGDSSGLILVSHTRALRYSDPHSRGIVLRNTKGRRHHFRRSRLCRSVQACVR